MFRSIIFVCCVHFSIFGYFEGTEKYIFWRCKLWLQGISTWCDGYVILVVMIVMVLLLLVIISTVS
jgi:hypothetical protein